MRNGNLLYHVTERKNVPSILKEGLVPKNGAFVSLSENPNSWYADGLSLLEVDVDDLDVEMRTWLPRLDEITVWGRIGPERIRVVAE